MDESQESSGSQQITTYEVGPANLDPKKDDDIISEPSDLESEKDLMYLDALSQEELQYIVSNSRYRGILSDLLAPFIEVSPSQAGSEGSADHTVTDDLSERGTNSVVYKLGSSSSRQGGADTSPSTASKKAKKRPSNGSSSQPRKRQKNSTDESRKRKHATNTLEPPTKRLKTASSQLSSSSESEDESFNPILEREDKDDFKVTVPKAIGKYVEKHFRRSLSKEERTAMLKRHPKPDTDDAKLDSFVADFAGKSWIKPEDSQLAKI